MTFWGSLPLFYLSEGLWLAPFGSKSVVRSSEVCPLAMSVSRIHYLYGNSDRC